METERQTALKAAQDRIAVERAEAEQPSEAKRLAAQPLPSVAPRTGLGDTEQPRQHLSTRGILGLTLIFDIVYWAVAIGAAVATRAATWLDIMPVILGALAVLAIMVVISFRVKSLKGRRMWIVFLSWLVSGLVSYPLGFGPGIGLVALLLMMGITGVVGFVVMYKQLH